MDQSLEALNQKIDLLAAQVQLLTDQTALASRARENRAELMRDVMPIVDDVFRLSTEQLEEVQEYVDLGDLLRLLKRLLRNGRNIDKMLDQLESLTDLVQTVGPLTDGAFEKATDLLQTAEQKGYFAVARGGARIMDNVVTSLSEEDVKLLGDTVVPLLNVIKEITQPQVMRLVAGTISDAQTEMGRPVDTSLRALLIHMRDPDVRRGLTLSLRVLGVIGAQAKRK